MRPRGSHLGCGSLGAFMPERDENGTAEGEGPYRFVGGDASRCADLSTPHRFRDRIAGGDRILKGNGGGGSSDALAVATVGFVVQMGSGRGEIL